MQDNWIQGGTLIGGHLLNIFNKLHCETFIETGEDWLMASIIPGVLNGLFGFAGTELVLRGSA